MEIVPVIDLKGGVVVRARRGDRDSYRPIETPLSRTSEVVDVVGGLLRLHPFKSLYVADLGAIAGNSPNADALARIEQACPGLRLLVDNGCDDTGAARAFLADHPRASLVLGSESQRNDTLLRQLRHETRVVLSLDFRGDAFLGPQAILDQADLWPDRVIVMTLARVGSSSGPDLERHAEIRSRSGKKSIYLAGGLRDATDLAAVEASGAAGVLVASALHDGMLLPADLARFD